MALNSGITLLPTRVLKKNFLTEVFPMSPFFTTAVTQNLQNTEFIQKHLFSWTELTENYTLKWDE
jgi:hypothetical protein